VLGASATRTETASGGGEGRGAMEPEREATFSLVQPRADAVETRATEKASAFTPSVHEALGCPARPGWAVVGATGAFAAAVGPGASTASMRQLP
jgi:hypothetical protein